MQNIKYIKCPNCGWVGDSNSTPEEIYVNLKTQVPTTIKTLELISSSKFYGFNGSFALCPNCKADLSDGKFDANSDLLIKDSELEDCNLCQGGGDVLWNNSLIECPKCFGQRYLPMEINQINKFSKTEYKLDPDWVEITKT